MKLGNVNLKDAGLWTCEVEEWEDYNVNFRNKGRKKGIIRQGRMNLQVTPNFKMVQISEDQKVVEGTTATLNCQASHKMGWCAFSHGNEKCETEQDISTKICGDDVFQGRASIKSLGKECVLTLNQVSANDNGTWSCEFERYHSGYEYGKGYGTVINRPTNLEVQMITTTTTPTTSTTTTTTTTTTTATTTTTSIRATKKITTTKKSSSSPNPNMISKTINILPSPPSSLGDNSNQKITVLETIKPSAKTIIDDDSESSNGITLETISDNIVTIILFGVVMFIVLAIILCLMCQVILNRKNEKDLSKKVITNSGILH